MSDMTYAEAANELAQGYHPPADDSDLVAAVDAYTNGWPPDNAEYLKAIGGTADGSMTLMAYYGEWNDSTGHHDTPPGPSTYAVLIRVGNAWECMDCGSPSDDAHRFLASTARAAARARAKAAPERTQER